MAGPGKPGRPSKGERHRKTVLLPQELVPIVKAHATRVGTDVNDYIVQTLAAAVGWEPPPPHQETLPFAEAS